MSNAWRIIRIASATGKHSILGVALVWASAASTASGASISDDVDALFREYDRTDGPGCSLGVLRDGDFVLKRSFGMADLEHAVPLSSTSVFRTGSVGKQFAAFAILLAEQQGELSLDDDIRKHLPELPETGETLTIRHLIHHTSGLRDYLTLMRLAGSRDEDFYTEEDILGALARQENLNFEPGTEYLYSNTGYFLLSQILPRATGMTLREFARVHMFEPLGMTASHFHDDFREIVPNRAEGYRPREEGGFEIDRTTLNMVGDGGVFTTVEDLLHWDRNFDTGEVGGKELALKRLETGRLDDGTPQDYAFGLRVSMVDGRRSVSHDGAFVGFRSSTIRFPDDRLSVYVLCNSAAAEPGSLARAVARLYLGPAPKKAGEKVTVPSAELERWTGTYYADDTGGLAELVLADGGLVWKERDAKLVPLGDGRFALENDEGEDAAAVALSEERGVARLSLESEGQRTFVYERVTPATPTLETLARHVGLYRCRELDVTYRIELGEDGALVLISPSFESTLEPVFEGGFRWESGSIAFRYDASGRPVGFELAAGRARNFYFERL